MQIANNIREKLLANWQTAHELNSFVECRVYDPASLLEYYIVAMNPGNEDELAAIIHGNSVELELVKWGDLVTMLNNQGEPLKIDHEYKREKALKVWGRLKRMERGEYGV